MTGPPGGELVVSAHLDDAVLSCGGTVAGLTRAGVPVTLVTVFAGLDGDPLPPFAARYHGWSGFPASAAELMAERRREDRAACAVLGAGWDHLDVAEAIYRRGPDGRPRCGTGDDVFSPPGPADAGLLAAVTRELAGRLDRRRPARLHLPTAVGGHLDHVLTRLAGEAAAAGSGPEVVLYEDLPYALDGAAGADPPPPGEPVAVPVGPGDWDRKVAAARHYASQHPVLWDPDWPDRLRAHAEAVGGGRPAERRWRVP